MNSRIWLLTLTILLLPQLAAAADFAAEKPYNLDVGIIKNRQAWNSWQFDVPAAAPGSLFLWDFGDGQITEIKDPVHNFKKFGTYKVTLSVSDRQGGIGTAETIVSLSFWNIHNLYLQIILAILCLSLIGFSVSLIFNIKLPYAGRF